MKMHLSFIRHTVLLSAVLALLPLGGCKARIAIQLERMYGREVEFPPSVVEVMSGDRMEGVVIPEGMNRMVLYFGKEDCSKCQAGRLAEFYDLIDTCRTRAVLPVVLFSDGSNMEEAEAATAQSYYSFPVFFDEEGGFAKANRFLPRDRRFHIFLIDKEDCVLYVGNPVANETAMKSFDLALSRSKNQYE